MQKTNENKTELVSKSAPVKMRALRPLYLKRTGKDSQPFFQEIPEKGEFECTEDEAKEFETPIVGQYDFGGERGSAVATRHHIVRAERV